MTAAESPSSSNPLEPGLQVGEYIIERKIGEGGFGAVYRASHPMIGKIAAIKVLSRQFSADPDVVSRFAAEARAVNQIRHRNIIDIFSFGTLPDGRCYYVMEFLDGESLGDHLQRVGAMPLASAIPVLDAVARALDAAHAKGIAHRDLKPDNVLLAMDPDGGIFPKLLDFGIAKLLGSTADGAMHKTRTGAPIGTPYYMSPEQCRGRDVDHRTDIYAFGVVAYQLLTGVVPFDGADYMEILMKQIGEEAPPPSQRNPDLPPAIDEVIAWMMRKDPAERPPDLATAITALAEAAAGAGVVLPPRPATLPMGSARTPAGGASRPRTPHPSGVAMEATMAATAPPGTPASLAAPPSTPAVTAAPSAPLVTSAPEASKRPLVIGVIAGVVVAAVVAVLVATSGKAASRPPAPPAGGSAPVAVVTPPAPAPPDAAPRLVVVDAGPAPLALVTITLAGAPDGAEVFGPGGIALGIAPKLQLPRGTTALLLTVRAEGYKPASFEVTPGGDQTIAVSLKKTGASRHGKAGSGDRNTIDNPFDP